jgi:D-sedoheptulose 7-phosphate isomerase
MTSFAKSYLDQSAQVCAALDHALIDRMTAGIADVRERGGRLFILGVGGSAANASHAVNDFRKLCDIEAYAPTDNVSELSARTNDEGWETVFAGWLRGSRANARDALLIFSVGGGNAEHNVSMNLVRAIDEAKQRGLSIFGIVGRDGGYTAKQADIAVIVPTIDPKHVTPHAEAFQAVIWHCLVSHPALQKAATKW